MIRICAAALLVCAAACSNGTQAPPGGVRIRFGGRVVAAEVARTVDERATGLMNRRHLGRDDGMLFVFPAPMNCRSLPHCGFYMKDTLIPLSIAFFRRDGNTLTVMSVMEMVPCTSQPCRFYDPGRPYDATLEMNKGWFASNGVRVGALAHIE